jgi:D-xylose transport system permease protein
MWIYNGAILLVTGGKTIPADQPYFNFISQGYLPPWLGWVIGAVVIALIFFFKVRSRAQKRSYGFQNPGILIDLTSTIIYSALIILYIVMVNQYNGLQMPVLIMLIAAVIVSYVATNTPFGRYVYAIGGNKEAARLSGINIRYTLFIVFVMMGLLCAVSGIVLASYVGYGTISAGTGYELDAIAACILGGTSTLGGIGTIPFALVGSLIMASITNGLQVMNIGPAWQYIVKGVVLIIAVFADIYFKRNR